MAYADRDRAKAWLDAGHGDKLSTTARIVLVTMAEEVNSKTGLAWPGHELMVTRWGIAPATVKRAIAQLCALGVVEVAQHGSFGRRSRYRLAGDLLPDTSVDASTEVHRGQGASQGTPSRAHTDTVTDSSGAHSVPVTGSLSTSNGLTVSPVHRSLLRSSNGVEDDDDDGATHRAPLGSPGAAPAMAVFKQIGATLGYDDSQTTEWIGITLNGRTVSNVDAYLLKCMNNQVADAAKAAAKLPAGRSSTKKAPAKAAAKKTAAGKPKRKRAGTPCKADGCDTHLVTAEAKFTGYCARHQQENRQYCKTEGHDRWGLTNVREMKAGYCRKCLAADLSQPAVWSESIKTDSLGFIIERRPTLDGWANLLLRADIPAGSTSSGSAAAKAGGQLFQAIAKRLYLYDSPHVWANAMDGEIPDDYFDFRVNDIREIVANGHVQQLARNLVHHVNATKGTAA